MIVVIHHAARQDHVAVHQHLAVLSHAAHHVVHHNITTTKAINSKKHAKACWLRAGDFSPAYEQMNGNAYLTNDSYVNAKVIKNGFSQ